MDDGRLVPNFITQALDGRPLTLHGDGSQTRSLCYVSDLVDGLMRAQFTPGTAGEIYNLGNPEEHTVRHFAEVIMRLCGSVSELIFEPKRQDDPERRRPDISKARRLLHWEPQVDLETGMARTIAWFRQARSEEQGATPHRPLASYERSE
jgi:nucleoside-diphosphate-sugar epimerase